jgi:hypothetical protein
LAIGQIAFEGRARSLVTEIDDDRLDRDFAFVQRNERLVAERRERVEIEFHRRADCLRVSVTLVSLSPHPCVPDQRCTASHCTASETREP